MLLHTRASRYQANLIFTITYITNYANLLTDSDVGLFCYYYITIIYYHLQSLSSPAPKGRVLKIVLVYRTWEVSHH